jgi:hypothetical protein
MNNLKHCRHVVLCIFALLFLAHLCAARQTNDPNQLYINLKQIEDKFPVPTPVATVWAGTFYPGGIPSDMNDLSSLMVYWKGPDTIDANGVNVDLSFDIYPDDPNFNAKVLWVMEGEPESVGYPPGKKIFNPPLPPPGRDGKHLLVSIGGRTYPRVFTVMVELISYKKEQVQICIKRPLLVGAGVYTIPVLPVAIIYEPPQGRSKNNVATYSDVKSVGTTIKTSVRKENSVTVPATPDFSDLLDFKSKINALSAACGAASAVYPNPYTAVAAAVLALFSSGLGSASASTTEGTSVTADHALTIECAKTDTYPTGLFQGPGLGDRILTRRVARVAWLADNEGGITLFLLPGSTKKPYLVSDLLDELYPKVAKGKTLFQKNTYVKVKPGSTAPAASPKPAAASPSNVGSGLSPEQLRALVELDPFAIGGPDVVLPESRFCFDDSYEPTSGSEIHTVTHTVTQEDMNAKTDFTIKMQDQSPGWLSFLGLGITEEKHVKNSATHTGSRAVQIGDKVSTTVDFHAEQGEAYCVWAYYDRVFGTFAFQAKPLSGQPALSGEVSDNSGQPAQGQLVTLVIDGKRYSTRTDAQGKYALRCADIPAGVGALTIANEIRQVTLQKGQTKDMEQFRVPSGRPSIREERLAAKVNPRFFTAVGGTKVEAEDAEMVSAWQPPPVRQDMTPFGPEWSGNAQLRYQATEPGGRFAIYLNAPAEGPYELLVCLTKGPDYGSVRAALDGSYIGEPFDCYAPAVSWTGEVSLGPVELTAGKHELAFLIQGKRRISTGYNAGLDYIVLKAASNMKQLPLRRR